MEISHKVKETTLKKSKQNSTLFIVIALIVIVIGISGYILNQFSKRTITTTPTTVPQFKTYHSDVMDFTIDVPGEYEITEYLGGVNLFSSNGQIYIDQNATNFEKLDEFLKDSKGTSYDKLKEKKSFKINGLDSVSGFIDERKIYFVYTDFNVYLLYTKDAVLYYDLDQIAKSFNYSPE